MDELDIEVRIGFYAKNFDQAQEVWENIKDALDWVGGIDSYAAEATIISQLPNELPSDLDEAIKKLPEYESETLEQALGGDDNER